MDINFGVGIKIINSQIKVYVKFSGHVVLHCDLSCSCWSIVQKFQFQFQYIHIAHFLLLQFQINKLYINVISISNEQRVTPHSLKGMAAVNTTVPELSTICSLLEYNKMYRNHRILKIVHMSMSDLHWNKLSHITSWNFTVCYDYCSISKL